MVVRLEMISEVPSNISHSMMPMTVPPWVSHLLPPQIWCLGNESRFHINQSVEGTVLATVLQGLVPGIPYHAEVAAATSAGVGTRSAPVPIHIGESLTTTTAPMAWEVDRGHPSAGSQLLGTSTGVCPFPLSPAAPPVERDVRPAGGGSLAERLAEVARRPAFIAGVGGACWVLLATFATWLYGRRRRKKELSHFTGTGGGYPWDLPCSPTPGTHHPTVCPLPLSLQRPLPTHPPVSP